MKVLIKQPNQPARLENWDIPVSVLNGYSSFNKNLKNVIGDNGIDKAKITNNIYMYVDDTALLRDDKSFNFKISGQDIYNTVVFAKLENIGTLEEEFADLTDQEVDLIKNLIV